MIFKTFYTKKVRNWLCRSINHTCVTHEDSVGVSLEWTTQVLVGKKVLKKGKNVTPYLLTFVDITIA
jgi:hypothetical protein